MCDFQHAVDAGIRKPMNDVSRMPRKFKIIHKISMNLMASIDNYHRPV